MIEKGKKGHDIPSICNDTILNWRRSKKFLYEIQIKRSSIEAHQPLKHQAAFYDYVSDPLLAELALEIWLRGVKGISNDKATL